MPATRAGRIRDLRGAARPMGAVMIGIGGAMALSTTVAWIWDLVAPSARIPDGGTIACYVSAAISLGLGAFVYAWASRFAHSTLSRREALLGVTLVWLAAAGCGALPFVLGARLSPVDAFFEAMSGLTTTGATVIGDIETRLSRPLLLWRSMIQWLGGMGIVVLFVAVFPSLGAGAKHLYKGEAPGAVTEGFKPRIAETSLILWRIYASLTALEAILLTVAGMDPFEAVCHALTTMATGGFSTRDSSVGGFANPTYEWIIAVFMVLASFNFGLYYVLLRQRSLKGLLRDLELRTFLWIVALATALLTLLNYTRADGPLDALRRAFFFVATTISSTGYGADDYTSFGMPALAIMLLLMFIGGCSGSTAGGLKVDRFVMTAKQTASQIRASFEPSVVQVVRMGRSVVSKVVLNDVTSFFVVYVVFLGVGVFVVAVTDGVPLETGFGAMLTSIANNGPAPFHGAAGFVDNFAAYSPVAKIFFALAMMLGRLEFFTVFALLLPGFWRR
ncbi:MAG: TrkH family potassium uptake protein [Sandaracinus sp.]|nr:TrkH family potassium uptake protein [Sandaracinus sp.]MCB9618275.1 TrkH family potassium uptake protein [Sandaracinus sp.]